MRSLLELLDRGGGCATDRDERTASACASASSTESSFFRGGLASFLLDAEDELPLPFPFDVELLLVLFLLPFPSPTAGKDARRLIRFFLPLFPPTIPFPPPSDDFAWPFDTELEVFLLPRRCLDFTFVFTVGSSSPLPPLSPPSALLLLLPPLCALWFDGLRACSSLSVLCTFDWSGSQ